jgi:hypothetical protein
MHFKKVPGLVGKKIYIGIIFAIARNRKSAF